MIQKRLSKRDLYFFINALYEVLQKVLSLGSDYFSATFYYKPSKYSPFTETHFCNLFVPSCEKLLNSLLLVSVGDTDK